MKNTCKSIFCVVLIAVMLTIVASAAVTTNAGFTANNVEAFSGYTTGNVTNARAAAQSNNAGQVRLRLYSIEASGESGYRCENYFARKGELFGTTYNNAVRTRGFRASAKTSSNNGFVFCQYNF